MRHIATATPPDVAPQLLRMPLGLKIALTLAGTVGSALLLVVAFDDDNGGAAERGAVVHPDHSGRDAHQLKATPTTRTDP